MPMYDFYCANCDKYSEKLIKSSDKSKPVCGKCGIEMEKVTLSFPNFIVKDGKKLSSTSYKKGFKEELRMPINVVDVNEDGTYKVTSTSKDPELLND